MQLIAEQGALYKVVAAIGTFRDVGKSRKVQKISLGSGKRTGTSCRWYPGGWCVMSQDFAKLERAFFPSRSKLLAMRMLEAVRRQFINSLL